MTVTGLLILILGVVCVGLLAYWVITKFFPAEMRTVAHYYAD